MSRPSQLPGQLCNVPNWVLNCGALGHAYLIPFDKRQKVNGRWETVSTEAQLIIGYRGMIDLPAALGRS
ncbi:hypothetical protein DMI69_07910 [Escherichia coli]|nr:hypothetical protein [Escherichia coli]